MFTTDPIRPTKSTEKYGRGDRSNGCMAGIAKARGFGFALVSLPEKYRERTKKIVKILTHRQEKRRYTQKR